MQTRRFPRLWRWLLVTLIALVTVAQIGRPGINQDVRYVLGALQTTRAAGMEWTEVWAHRPFFARGMLWLLDALSPSQYWGEEILVRFWSIGIAAVAAISLALGLRRWAGARGSGWIGLAAFGGLAWAPGWNFAQPEWFAVALATLAVGVALLADRGPMPPITAGILLAVVILLKFTTAPTALVALMLLAAIDIRLARMTAVITAIATPILFGVSVLIAPHEWQWLVDMPTLNPPLTAGAILGAGKGLVNCLVVSPITLVALVAQVWLWQRGGAHRQWALWNLAMMALLIVPFVVQHQNFLYHLAALPVFSAISVATIAHRAVRIGDGVPVALPTTAAIAFGVSALLFMPGTAFRSNNTWLALIAVLAVLGTGTLLVWWQPSAFRDEVIDRTSSGRGWMAMCCLLPLLVTLSPRAAYSFSLSHRTVTPAVNLAKAKYAGATAARVHLVLPPDTPVIYLAFGTPWVLGNPTPCRYASPTFLQRATGKRAERIEGTRSFKENLACLSDQRARAAVIETSWFDPATANPRVAAALAENFDCERRLWSADDLWVCPRR